MTSLNVKMDLIRLDMAVKDIHRIWSEVPSDYTYPKSLLAQSRALVRSDVKKALNYADKARKLFQKESVLATRYNSIADKVENSGENARVQRNHYLKYVSDGDYKNAEETLDKVISMVGKSEGIGTHVTLELISSDENGCVLSFNNTGEYTVMVTTLNVTKGSERVKTNPKATFSVQPKSVRKVTVSSSPPGITVSAEYTEHGENRSIHIEL